MLLGENSPKNHVPWKRPVLQSSTSLWSVSSGFQSFVSHTADFKIFRWLVSSSLLMALLVSLLLSLRLEACSPQGFIECGSLPQLWPQLPLCPFSLPWFIYFSSVTSSHTPVCILSPVSDLMLWRNEFFVPHCRWLFRGTSSSRACCVVFRTIGRPRGDSMF